jgi:hypothetical protein
MKTDVLLFFLLTNFLTEVFPKSETTRQAEESLSSHAHEETKISF